MAAAATIRKLSPKQLDELADRAEGLRLELELARKTFMEQVEEFGFTPPRAEKSKRLLGERWQITLSYGDKTEINDVAVETLKKSCPAEIYEKLFSEETKYKLVSGATMLLAQTLPAGAPPNLRKLFSAAVQIKAKNPSLTVHPIKDGGQ